MSVPTSMFDDEGIFRIVTRKSRFKTKLQVTVSQPLVEKSCRNIRWLCYSLGYKLAESKSCGRFRLRFHEERDEKCGNWQAGTRT